MGNTIVEEMKVQKLTKLPRTYGKYAFSNCSRVSYSQTSTHVWEIQHSENKLHHIYPNFHARMGNTSWLKNMAGQVTKLPRTYGKYLKIIVTLSAMNQTSTHVWEIHGSLWGAGSNNPNFHARMGNTNIY